MSIWFQPWDLAEANQRGAAFANGHLGIELTEVGADYQFARKASPFTAGMDSADGVAVLLA